MISEADARAAASSWPRLPEVARDVLLEVLIHGPLSRAEIATRLRLSRPTLTRVTRVLVARGLLVEGDTRPRASAGRPSEMLHVRGPAHRFLGVKLTADRLFAAVTDLTATVLTTVDEPLHSTAPDDVVARIADVARRFPGLTGIGVTLGGVVLRRAGGAGRVPALDRRAAEGGGDRGDPRAHRGGQRRAGADRRRALVRSRGGAEVAGGDHRRRGRGHRPDRVRRARRGFARPAASLQPHPDVLIGTVANVIDPQKVLLTGDGLPLYEVSAPLVHDGIEDTYEDDPDLIDLDVRPFDFSEWARSGAALAIKATITGSIDDRPR